MQKCLHDFSGGDDSEHEDEDVEILLHHDSMKARAYRLPDQLDTEVYQDQCEEVASALAGDEGTRDGRMSVSSPTVRVPFQLHASWAGRRLMMDQPAVMRQTSIKVQIRRSERLLAELCTV